MIQGQRNHESLKHFDNLVSDKPFDSIEEAQEAIKKFEIDFEKRKTEMPEPFDWLLDSIGFCHYIINVKEEKNGSY